MGRPRKPTNVHFINGTAKQNPARMREREDEPKDDRPLGEPPDHLSEVEKGIWDELAKNAIDGVLCRADRHLVESTCKLLARLRDQQSVDDVRREMVLDAIEQVDDDATIYAMRLLLRFVTCPPGYTASDQSNLSTALRQMGMAPADRSKISKPKPQGRNKFDED